MHNHFAYLAALAVFCVSCTINEAVMMDNKTALTERKVDNLSDTKADKICALTFDDGPNSILTARVLDKLDKYQVKATFFMVGQNVNASTKPIIDRVVTSGHEIGNHSWNYNGLESFTAEQVKKYIDDTTAAIEKYAGVTPRFFRPPNLSVSAAMYAAIPLPFVSGVLGNDWAGQNTSAEDRANRVLAGMRDGAIILLHDVQPAPHPTPEALDILIPRLKQLGYRFVTLSELFKLKGVSTDVQTKKLYVYLD
jgi:peptidoglycan/xylan/chitin deacetylase (PgdA/CDA1 family)